MDERKPAIRSVLEDVSELTEEIDRFVVTLGERVDEIQDAELASCAQELASLCGRLAGDADRLGYPELCSVARETANAGHEARAEMMREGVAELTEVAHRIRRGHRSAA